VFMTRVGSVVELCFSSRRGHTSSSRDWSSDVCSSDLASLATWRYSYMASVYQTPHTVAATATSLLWVGVLAGRVSAIPLSGKFSERTLLITGAALCLLALGADWLVGVPWVAMAALVFAGYGVSGAFQLGTSWGAGMIPQSIGIASSLVMASASLGGLILPSLTAVVADHFGFQAFRW